MIFDPKGIDADGRTKSFKYGEQNNSMQKMITISKEEYENLKEAEQVDHELLIKIVKGLEDVKNKRFKEW